MVSRADNVITNTEAGAKPAMAASPQRQRDYLLDNYKALLITLVDRKSTRLNSSHP